MSSLDWYAHKSVGDGLFWIQERFYESGNRANIWVIRGSHQDVVIDAGLGLRSLPDYIKANGLLGDDSQRKNPLLAIGTHVHFDHSGGLHQFQQVGVHKAEVDALANGDNFETVTWLSDREIVESPAPGWRARQYRVKAVQPTHILQDGMATFVVTQQANVSIVALAIKILQIGGVKETREASVFKLALRMNVDFISWGVQSN